MKNLNSGQNLMDNQKYKSYHLNDEKPTIHKINVWNCDSTHCFLYMSCDICRYHDRCLHTKHKNEICTVAPKVEKLFSKFIYGRVSSFASDEFYIDEKFSKRRDITQFKEIVKFLRMKYIKDPNENVRN